MFRQIIKREVKRQKLSGYRLAQLSGVPARSVQAYLKADMDLSGARLAKLCDALGLELRPKRRRTKGA